MAATLTLIRGLPGSGKSTLAKRLVAGDLNAYHFEADQFFMVDGVYQYDAGKIPMAHKWCQNKTAEYLECGCNVIVSNTFTTVKELMPYFEIAKRFEIVPTVITCQNQFENVHNVPEEAMKRMRDRFQHDIGIMFF